MFTGIIQEIGTVDSIQRAKSLIQLTIHAPKLASRVKPLESVAVNGVCLTVVREARGCLQFDVIPETEKLTNLGLLRVRAKVNLEPSLTLEGRLNGHVVLGHIDGSGTIVKRIRQSGQLILTIHVSKALRAGCVPKGSIALDGISLTLGASLAPESIVVYIIPKTLQETTLGFCRVGQMVNIEIDYIAKLVIEVLKRERSDSLSGEMSAFQKRRKG